MKMALKIDKYAEIPTQSVVYEKHFDAEKRYSSMCSPAFGLSESPQLMKVVRNVDQRHLDTPYIPDTGGLVLEARTIVCLCDFVAAVKSGRACGISRAPICEVPVALISNGK